MDKDELTNLCYKFIQNHGISVIIDLFIGLFIESQLMLIAEELYDYDAENIQKTAKMVKK